MIHGHITAWVLALILFVVALFLYKGAKAKGAKIVHMILRVFYLLIIATGFMILPNIFDMTMQYTLLYILKLASGIWVIALFEMILGKTAGNRKTSITWIQFVVALALVLYLGFVSLPMSFLNP
jgi:hypothetical protein